jgi:hypothetical protein
MTPYEVLMRGFGQFTGILPGTNMPLNVNPNYATPAPSPVTIGGPSSPIDPIGTRSYQQLGSQVDSALQRNLPRSFTGAGIQNAPMNIIGQVSDLADMPEGAAKEAARNQIQRNLRMADRGLQPPGRPAGQGPGGAFRAPGVGSNPPRSTPTTVAPRSTLPQTGGPLARDYSLGRSTGTVDQFRKLRQSAAPLRNAGASGVLGGVSRFIQGPLTAVPLGVTLFNQGQSGSLLDKATNLVPGMTADPETDVGKRLGDSISSFISGLGKGDNRVRGRSGAARAQRQAAAESRSPLAMRERFGGSGDMDAGDAATYTPQGAYVFDSDTPAPVPRRLPTTEELERRAYEQEVSRIAQQSDPYFRGGGSPMVNYTADQGMAINQALYGDMLTPNTPNPLMAGLTFDQSNPTMQGRNYNMENPVGVQQSAAQALSDYYRNGMMEQQTGFGSEPGLESVLSPEDRSMYLAQLRNFQPGGPGYGR